MRPALAFVIHHGMATQKETADFILSKLRDPNRFSARAMFGEYALYADGEVVALICDDRLYVKILPASSELEGNAKRRPLSRRCRITLSKKAARHAANLPASFCHRQSPRLEKQPARKPRRSDVESFRLRTSVSFQQLPDHFLRQDDIRPCRTRML